MRMALRHLHQVYRRPPRLLPLRRSLLRRGSWHPRILPSTTACSVDRLWTATDTFPVPLPWHFSPSPDSLGSSVRFIFILFVEYSPSSIEVRGAHRRVPSSHTPPFFSFCSSLHLEHRGSKRGRQALLRRISNRYAHRSWRFKARPSPTHRTSLGNVPLFFYSCLLFQSCSSTI